LYRLRLQLLLCRLEERQAALREVVESEQAEVLDMSDRMYRKYVRTLDRKNQDIAKVAEKARQEKAAEKARALRSWRSDLGDRASAARELRNARNRGILRAHDRMLRAATKSKEDARTRRMEALKVITPILSAREALEIRLFVFQSTFLVTCTVRGGRSICLSALCLFLFIIIIIFRSLILIRFTYPCRKVV
jgi:hypothetical protein